MDSFMVIILKNLFYIIFIKESDISGRPTFSSRSHLDSELTDFFKSSSCFPHKLFNQLFSELFCVADYF